MEAARQFFFDGILLLSATESGMLDENGESAFSNALYHYQLPQQSLAVVELLGRIPSEQDAVGMTELMKAASYNDLSGCVANLKQAGMQSRANITALQYAVIYNNRDAVQLLRPYEKRMQNWAGETALIVAAQLDHIECAELLVDLDCGITDTRGRCALMNAIEYDRPACIKFLAQCPREFAVLPESMMRRLEQQHDMQVSHNLRQQVACVLDRIFEQVTTTSKSALPHLIKITDVKAALQESSSNDSQDVLRQQFLEAVKQNDSRRAMQLLKMLDLSLGFNPLAEAARLGSILQVKNIMLWVSCAVFWKDAVVAALEANMPKTFELLLTQIPQLQNKDLIQLAGMALEKKRMLHLRYIIANTRFQSALGSTPLMLAAYCGKVCSKFSWAQLLNEKDAIELRIIDYGIIGWNDKLIRLLLQASVPMHPALRSCICIAHIQGAKSCSQKSVLFQGTHFPPGTDSALRHALIMKNLPHVRELAPYCHPEDWTFLAPASASLTDYLRHCRDLAELPALKRLATGHSVFAHQLTYIMQENPLRQQQCSALSKQSRVFQASHQEPLPYEQRHAVRHSKALSLFNVQMIQQAAMYRKAPVPRTVFVAWPRRVGSKQGMVYVAMHYVYQTAIRSLECE